MRILILLLLASCAFGQGLGGTCDTVLYLDYSLGADRENRIDSLLSDLDKRLKALESPVSTPLGGWSPIIVCDTMRYPASAYPGWCAKNGHSWAWGDTTEQALTFPFGLLPTKIRCEAPAICRNCLADTTAVWSYAEDQRRRELARPKTEYERLKARKK